SRTAHRASTARTGSLTRTARLRLSRPPLTPPSTPLARSQRQRVGPLVPQAPAPRPERASDGSRARVPRRAPAPGGRLTDRRPATNHHLAVDDDRLRGSHPLGVPIRDAGYQRCEFTAEAPCMDCRRARSLPRALRRVLGTWQGPRACVPPRPPRQFPSSGSISTRVLCSSIGVPDGESRCCRR
ncbi:MAG: hypothetical protein RLZZ36_1530, partial [Pseudomonadota bacterium]